MEDEPSPESKPPIFEIPNEAIKRWDTLSNDQSLIITVGRNQMDALFLGLRQGLIANMKMNDAINKLISDDPGAAKEGLQSSKEDILTSYSNINHFIAFVMATAQPEPSDGGND